MADTDDSLSSEIEVGGHREEITSQAWEDAKDCEINNLKADMEALKEKYEHLEWHCSMYVEALRKFTNGLQVLKETINNFCLRNDPVCRLCEKDELLASLAEAQQTIKALRDGETSPVYNHSSFKRKYSESQQLYHPCPAVLLKKFRRCKFFKPLKNTLRGRTV